MLALVVSIMALAGIAGAVSINDATGASQVVDLSDEGEIRFVLTLGEPSSLLTIDVSPAERLAPLELRASIVNDSGLSADQVEIEITSVGAVVQTTGVFAFDTQRPTRTGVTSTPTLSTLDFTPARPFSILEMGPGEDGGDGWLIDVGGLPQGVPLEIEMRIVPEPGVLVALLCGLTFLLMLVKRRGPTRKRIREARALGKGLVILGLLLELAIDPARAAAATLVVDDPVDGASGSLRDAIENLASAGDLITFSVSEVILDNVLAIPAGLDGLVVQGPVTIRPAPGLNGFVDVLANGVHLVGLTFVDVSVGANSAASVAGLEIRSGGFQGDAGIDLEFETDCVIANNVFVVNDFSTVRTSSPIDLSATERCMVLDNEITSPRWSEISDRDSEELTIDHNTLTGGIFSTQIGGAVTRNTARQIGIYSTGAQPHVPLLVEMNTVQRMRVSRTHVEVVNNTIDFTTSLSFGLIDVAMSVVNGDPRGGTGTVSVRDNQITGAQLGLLYVDVNGATVPGEVIDNVASACTHTGFLLSRPKGTVVRNNTATSCSGPGGTGLKIQQAQSLPLLADINTVTGGAGGGIDVSQPSIAVTLRGSSVSGVGQSGIRVYGSDSVTTLIEGGSSQGNGASGVLIGTSSRARVDGGAYASNAAAGIFAADDAAVEIRDVMMQDNGGPGIDLAPVGVTSNAATKLANADVDWPESLRVDGSIFKLVGQSEPGATIESYLVEADPRIGNPMNGEGVFRTSSVVADGSGRFELPPIGYFACASQYELTLTATRPGAVPVTSEFSTGFDCGSPVFDRDGDGVLDSADTCPRTNPGDPVDGEGCRQPPVDSDSDGVADDRDLCANTDPGVTATATGCGADVAHVSGAVAHCASPADCSTVDPVSGGPCVSCSVESADGSTTADCSGGPAASTCSVSTEGEASCAGCSATILRGAAQIECNGTCGPIDYFYQCEGGPGECRTTFGDGRVVACPDDEACLLLLENQLKDTNLFGVLTVAKIAQPTDGTFEFRLDAVDSSTGEEFLRNTSEISTQGGAGTRVIRYVLSTDELIDGLEFLSLVADEEIYQIEEDLPDPSWSIDSLNCDNGVLPFSGGFEIVLDSGEETRCTFSNSRAAPPVVRNAPTMPESVNGTETFGLAPGNRIVISGATQSAVIDTDQDVVPSAGGQQLSVSNVLGQGTGALIVPNPDGNGEDAFFVYGPNGIEITRYENDFGGFGFTVSQFFPSFTDALQYGDDPSSTSAIGVNFSTRFIFKYEWSAPDVDGNRSYGGGGPIVFSSQFSALVERPISAFLPTSPTHLLIALANATPGLPGKLAIADLVTPTAVSVIGDLQNDPRRVRCEGTLCAVTNFGSDSITLVSWDGSTGASILGTASVGDGPIGVSLRPLGANFAIATTGSLDDTVTITEVTPAGAVVNTQTFAAPAGCTGPGFPLWLRDASESLVISCNTSDAYAVLTPGIP